MIDLTALRKACELATPGKWFARNRFLSLVANNSSMGATLPTNHIGVMAEREDAAFIAAARSAVPALLDRVEDLEAGFDALTADLATARESLREACDLLDKYRGGIGTADRPRVAELRAVGAKP